MPSDPRIPKLDAPGLKLRPNKNGAMRLYLVARPDRVKEGLSARNDPSALRQLRFRPSSPHRASLSYPSCRNARLVD